MISRDFITSKGASESSHISVNPPIPELQRRGLPYLKKPFELDELLAKVDALIYQGIDVITYQYIQTAHHG